MENKTIPIADPIREFQKIKNFNNLFIKEFHKGRYVGGENVVQLEEKLKHRLKAKYIVTTNSGTDALILSVAQLNLKKGDEILVPSFTFFATIEALMHFGLKPVFLDINKETFTVDEKSFFENVSKKTKAFLPVHLFGRSSFNDKILDFCRVNGIKIIEDCAQSFGSKFKNKHLGTLGDLGAFSFFPSKTLGGIGDGGCISTNNYENFVSLKKLANHGQKNLYEHEISGVNSRLDSLNAFVLNLKLDIFENISNSRINLYNYFDKNIDNDLVEKPYFNAQEVPNYYSLLIKKNRNKFIKYLNANSISTNIYYQKPIHKQPALKNYNFKVNDMKNTNYISSRIVSIPFFAFMKNQEKEKIVKTINSFEC